MPVRLSISFYQLYLCLWTSILNKVIIVIIIITGAVFEFPPYFPLGRRHAYSATTFDVSNASRTVGGSVI